MNTDQAFKVDMVTLANDIMNNVDADTRAQLESFVSQYEAGDISREAVSQFLVLFRLTQTLKRSKLSLLISLMCWRLGLV